MTAERIRDKVAANRRKGIWMGGVPPYGYRVENRKLVVDEDAAAHEVTPQVQAAVQAETQMIAAISGLMSLLTWQDFELLVDLVFSSSGWKRAGATGGVQNTVDIELVLPSTQERAFVQVKSRATPAQLNDYVRRMAEIDGVHRMLFFWHMGDVGAAPEHGRVTLVGPAHLARMVLDAGLATWLRAKVG